MIVKMKVAKWVVISDDWIALMKNRLDLNIKMPCVAPVANVAANEIVTLSS